MYLNDMLEAARIYRLDHYVPELDINGEKTIDVNAPISWTDVPVESANDLRRAVIDKTLRGEAINRDNLSAWALVEAELWIDDAKKLMDLGIEWNNK